MYVLVVGIIYFIVIMMMFAYIDNLYYNKTYISTKKRTIYWNRVIVSTVVVFSISLLVLGIIYNMRENRSVIVPEPVIYYDEIKPVKQRRKRLTEAERLDKYTREIYPDYN